MSSMMMPIASLIGSALSAAWTAYFWLVKVRRERPDLRAHLADHDLFLGGSLGGTRQVGLKFGLIAANYSSLPNALLGVRLWLRLKDGTWLPVEGLSYDKATPLPFNVPAMQTVLVRVTGRVAFPYADELEGHADTLRGYLDRHLAERRQVGVELEGLAEYVSSAELPLD